MVACLSVLALLVLAHGIGNAADDAGAVDLGFIAPVRSADGLADEAIARASRGDEGGAERLARKAVRRLPVKQSVVRKLAEIERVTAGKDSWSEAATASATMLGWRDGQTQARLLMVSAANGDIVSSIDHVDAVLRRTEISRELFAAIGQILTNAQIRAVLVERLQSRPPWREALFGAVTDFGDTQSTPALAQLLVDLDASEGGPLPSTETDPVLSKLAALDLDAELLRTASALDRTSGAPPLLNDRQFAGLVEDRGDAPGGPFEWKRGRAERTVITLVDGPDEGKGGAAGVKVRSRSRVPGVLLFQNLRLAPGAYTFRYRYQKVDKGLSWQVSCGDNVLGTSVPVPAGSTAPAQWRGESLDLSIPASCPIQRLQLLTGRNLDGQSIAGTFSALDLQAR